MTAPDRRPLPLAAGGCACCAPAGRTPAPTIPEAVRAATEDAGDAPAAS